MGQEFNESVNSVTEENVATMLPTVGLDGKPVDGKSDEVLSVSDIQKDVKTVENTSIDIEFSEAVVDYINNPETIYDDMVEEGVKDVVNALKERVVVSNQTAKLVVDIYILKRKIKKSEKFDNEKRTIDLKRELVKKQQELNKVKKTASKNLRKEICKIEAKLNKSGKINDEKEIDSVEDVLQKSEETKVKEEDKNITESFTEEINDVIIEESSEDKDEKRVSPELKRLDEVRGKIAELEKSIDEMESERSKAKKKFEETGEKIYENKIKGFTAKIEKAEKDLKIEKDKLSAGEKELKKEEKKIMQESEEFIEAAYVSINGRIDYWKQMIKDIKKKIAEKIVAMKKITNAGDKVAAEKEIITLKDKLESFKEKLAEVIDEKENGPKPIKGVGFHGKMHTAYASTNDIIDGDSFTEAANIEDEMKPIVQKLNDKGYKVKYSSPGHRSLRKKEDKEPDGVYYNKLYSDARVMFDNKYSFPDSPKYWHWRDVDGCSYLDITPIPYKDKDGNPDDVFKKWKENYMNSLKEFVDGLKDNSEKDVKEDVNVFAESLIEEIHSKMGFDELEIDGLVVNESVSITEENNSKDLLKELDDLLS